ncbi:MAG: hemolysin III family protein [Pseudomonadota bacterium]
MDQQPKFERAERISDAAIHVMGVVFALMAAPVAITLAAVWLGDLNSIMAATIYGLSLVAMLTCSAIYHLLPVPAWKDRLRRLDQSAIYVKIAGTYTPFVVLAAGSTGAFLAGIWSAALAGAAAIAFGPTWMRWPSLALYLGIGWAGLLAGGSIFAEMTNVGFGLIVAGGCLYTIGVLFFLWRTLPFHTAIWHGFVLVASALFYSAVIVEFRGHAVFL